MSPEELYIKIRNGQVYIESVDQLPHFEGRGVGVLSKGVYYWLADQLKSYGDFKFFSAIIQKSLWNYTALAQSDANVLITGETGTGKELLARLIGNERNPDNYLAINCAAIPRELAESELFGHTKGAFTGATKDKKGAFLNANGGTVFLDEIQALSHAMQAKLLRVLNTDGKNPTKRSIQRLGATKPEEVDVRVICASNQNIFDEKVREKINFKHDLYFRIAQSHIHIPPLRDRGFDIILLLRDILLNGLVLPEKYKITEQTFKVVRSAFGDGEFIIQGLKELEDKEFDDVKKFKNEIKKTRAKFTVNDLSSIGIPNEIIKGLNSVKNQKFEFQEEFLNKLDSVIGTEKFSKYREKISNSTKVGLKNKAIDLITNLSRVHEVRLRLGRIIDILYYKWPGNYRELHNFCKTKYDTEGKNFDDSKMGFLAFTSVNEMLNRLELDGIPEECIKLIYDHLGDYFTLVPNNSHEYTLMTPDVTEKRDIIITLLEQLLDKDFTKYTESANDKISEDSPSDFNTAPLDKLMNQHEKNIIQHRIPLHETFKEAAKSLGIDEDTLRNRRNELGIDEKPTRKNRRRKNG